MVCDGLCVLTSYNTPKLKQMRMNQELNNWGVVYAVTMNVEKTLTIGRFLHKNESI